MDNQILFQTTPENVMKIICHKVSKDDIMKIIKKKVVK